MTLPREHFGKNVAEPLQLSQFLGFCLCSLGEVYFIAFFVIVLLEMILQKKKHCLQDNGPIGGMLSLFENFCEPVVYKNGSIF